MSSTTIAIQGAAGRMGQRLIALSAADDSLQLVAALEHSEHPMLGQDAGLVAGAGDLGVPLSHGLSGAPQVVIDFSVPASADAITVACLEQNCGLVMATTGLNDEQEDRLRAASKSIPIVWAPNMSLAVNLTMNLVKSAAATLKDLATGVDAEVIDRHHRFKEDSPRGTALLFGKIIADEMGLEHHTHGRHGMIGQRPRNEIGYHALRVGDNPGEHTIVFGMLGETMEFTVRANNRDCYAQGALEAAKFVAGKSPGIYSMDDVLGLG